MNISVLWRAGTACFVGGPEDKGMPGAGAGGSRGIEAEKCGS